MRHAGIAVATRRFSAALLLSAVAGCSAVPVNPSPVASESVLPSASMAAAPSPSAQVQTTPQNRLSNPFRFPPTSASPCPQPALPLDSASEYNHGNLDLGVRFALGSVAFLLAPCRDIDSVRAEHGLGPAERIIRPDQSDSEFARRYYRAAVPVGREAATV